MTDLDREMIQSVNVWIYGWKSLASYFRIHPRTLQRWDARFPIPWEKQGPRKNHSVRVHVKVADAYFSLLQQVDKK